MAFNPYPHDTLRTVRRGLLAILLLGLAGTLVELYLLKHTEGVWELLPIFLTALALVALAWYPLGRSPAAIRFLQALMGIFLLVGLLGVYLHLRANLQYSRESNPSLSGWELYREAIMGATPMLAPGTMIQLGLVGLLMSFRHPRLHRQKPSHTE